ncbi:MAG: DUF7340 domain-containing protein, partial [Mycobacterium sp.]
AAARQRDECSSGILLPLALTPPKVDLPMPCPHCGARFAYRRDDAGDRVRALRVSETGCRCQGCQAYWPPEQFEWLARLLVEEG